MIRLEASHARWMRAAAALSAALVFVVSGPAQAQQAGGRAKVLVAPLTAESGVSENFGRKVSEAVRDRLEGVTALAPIGEDAVEDELDRLDVDEDDLGLVQWRQLANQLDADLLIHGTITKVPRGNAFHVSFTDVRSGDATPIPAFVVEDDGGRGVREAADGIMDAMRSQVEYQRAILICSDYVASERYEDAARNCEQALRINPNSRTARYLMGRIEMGRENWQAAKENLDMVIEANPAEVDALNSLAYTEAKLGNTARARELYNEYLGFDPDAADVRMQVAYDLARTGDHDGAIGLLRDGIARDSTNADMWKFLGDVLLNKGTSSDVVTDATSDSTQLQRVENTDVQDEDAIRQAIEAYEKVLTLRGAQTDPQVLRNVVAAYLQLDDIPEAARFAERAEQRLPEDASLRSLKADILARQGDYAGAVTAMNAALRLDPDLPRGLARRGFFKLSAGDEEGAMADFRTAVEEGVDPDIVAQQMLRRGYDDYFQAGQYDRAAQVFEAALEFAQTPATSEQIHFFTAFSYYQAGANVDTANESEACGPARRALDRFQQVLPHLGQAANFQAPNQAEIREATDMQLYRQEAILNKPACR